MTRYDRSGEPIKPVLLPFHWGGIVALVVFVVLLAVGGGEPTLARVSAYVIAALGAGVVVAVWRHRRTRS